ncbi:MAG: STAS domain-containing protein [Candidatus Competibacteraceae bacterium]|uniref:Anti-sigma factor antagonist n=1 Tax=Candidatus Contendobacter odensis Run_B_J11 TaxID=1400861 RepID=A0A7U7GCR6_9GAMM|nr:STAS domain-containing protein [Candidatus Contendobacter odensis]MBK8537611.1 STAS domain-containing protein [Candidatus Competibacteraceae bacterium]CDH46013.1 Stage II sporulation protein [Candidatus Contendobacter odensis Run_B_J11]
MEIQQQQQGHVIVLGPVGRLDSLSCREFETRLLAALDQSESVVVDCTALDYISSAGLRALLVAAKRNRTSGGRLALAVLRDSIREVFDISGFTAIFAIHPTVAAAVASLG